MWYSSITKPRKSIRSSIKKEKQSEEENFPAERQSTCLENLNQYLLNSTLHGLRYVGERQISVFERVFFVLSFLFVLILSIYFISNIYQKWTASPIIIAQNAYATSISDFPFPAVTVCNLNQARKSKIQDIREGTIESMLLKSLCQLSNEEDLLVDYTGKWGLFRNFLLNVSQPCAEMLVLCKFGTETHECMELFNSVLTDDGLCCTFNNVHPSFLLQHYNSTDEFDSVNNTGNLTAVDWTPEKGWSSGTRATTYPRPAAGPGSHMGLSVILDAGIEDYYCSSGNSAGFKILLHNPTETPKISDYGFSVALGQETRVTITPKLSDASPLIRSVPDYQRQCIFANEANLTYFRYYLDTGAIVTTSVQSNTCIIHINTTSRTYSRKNCEMECEARIIEDICGCVQFFMPRLNEDTNICNQKDFKCFDELSVAIELGHNQTYSCSCLPGCFEISYKPSVYIAELGTGNYLLRDKELMSINEKLLRTSISVVHIYYEDSYFRSFTKEELIGFTEFLSNTGGLLGLFLGFSVVSIIEILYFISLRPYCASRRDRKKLMNNVKSVEPSNKVWFVEDVHHGKLSQVKQLKNGWDFSASKKVEDLQDAFNGGGSKAKMVVHYPYRD